MSVTVGFYKGRHSGHLFSWLLAWLDRTIYSHAVIVWAVLDDGAAYVSEATIAGVRTHTRVWKPELWELVEVKAEAIDVHRWWLSNEGRPYDAIGLLGFIARRIKGLRGAYWCSEAVAASLGLRDPWRFTVAMLRVVVDLLEVARRSEAPTNNEEETDANRS